MPDYSFLLTYASDLCRCRSSSYDPFLDLSVPIHKGESEPPKRCKCDAGEKKGFYFDSVYCEPFLDHETTPTLARAFYIPWYSDQTASYGAYHVLQKLTCDCN